MIASERTQISRAVRGAFSWFGNRLSATTVLLVAVVVWCSACSTSPYCDERGDYGICSAMEAQVSGVQYGDRKPDDGEISASGSYACAFSYGINSFGSGFGGGIDCLNPAFDHENWESGDWGITVYLRIPDEVCSLSDASRDCYTTLSLSFEQSVGIPHQGAVFDLAQARIAEDTHFACADYEITGGTIEFVTVEADQYSFKIHDLAFTRSLDEGGAETSDCYIPETVTIELISIDCVPTVENMYC